MAEFDLLLVQITQVSQMSMLRITVPTVVQDSVSQSYSTS